MDAQQFESLKAAIKAAPELSGIKTGHYFIQDVGRGIKLINDGSCPLERDAVLATVRGLAKNNLGFELSEAEIQYADHGREIDIHIEGPDGKSIKGRSI